MMFCCKSRDVRVKDADQFGPTMGEEDLLSRTLEDTMADKFSLRLFSKFAGPEHASAELNFLIAVDQLFGIAGESSSSRGGVGILQCKRSLRILAKGARETVSDVIGTSSEEMLQNMLPPGPTAAVDLDLVRELVLRDVRHLALSSKVGAGLLDWATRSDDAPFPYNHLLSAFDEISHSVKFDVFPRFKKSPAFCELVSLHPANALSKPKVHAALEDVLNPWQSHVLKAWDKCRLVSTVHGDLRTTAALALHCEFAQDFTSFGVSEKHLRQIDQEISLLSRGGTAVVARKDLFQPVELACMNVLCDPYVALLTAPADISVLLELGIKHFEMNDQSSRAASFTGSSRIAQETNSDDDDNYANGW